ncbi:thiol-disulfide oxidoreductase DCC family protein [Rubritalea sp.]|uniref:thiol-disulfide oxidoreductase DCC family protein n=1 Tax=Rubritalea sp. TaxID=2109375 RepID=UPI003EF6FA84
METRSIFFYDGGCGFCNRSVNLLMDYSDDSALYFCPLQSELAKEIFSQHKQEPDLQSSYLLKNGTIYGDSSAVLYAFTICRAPVNILGTFRFIPPFLRDTVYKLIAKNRHMISKNFNSACRIPSNNERARFLDS